MPVGYQENGKIKYKSMYARTLSEVKEKMSEVHSIRQNQPVSAIKLTVREVRNQAMRMILLILNWSAAGSMGKADFLQNLLGIHWLLVITKILKSL